MKKTAIITGAAGNLGKALVTKFIEEGYYVVGTIHTKPTGEGVTKNTFEEVALDLLNEKGSLQFVNDVVEKHSEINVAVLTAGGFAMGNISSTKTSDIYKQYQLNFETAYNILRPVFLQMLKQNSGRIFLIGSKAGLDVSKAKGVTAYALSKSLLFKLAELMNAEAQEKNVVISVIVPGIIDTPENRKLMPGEDFSNWVTPAQIAKVIYFYCTDAAKTLREPIIKIYHHS